MGSVHAFKDHGQNNQVPYFPRPLLQLELLKAEEFQGTKSGFSIDEVVPPSASPVPVLAPQERGKGCRMGSQAMNTSAQCR